MNEIDIAWAAGLLEGEACFDFGGAGGKTCPRIRVEMTDEDVILRLQSVIGGNVRMYPSAKRKNAGPNWSDTYKLGLYSRATVEPVLFAIRPYMGQRRGEKIDFLLASYD